MIKSERARGARTEEASIVVASQTSAHGGKAAFSCVVPERSRALRESAGPAAKRKKLSTSCRQRREIQGRVSALLRSLTRLLVRGKSISSAGRRRRSRRRHSGSLPLSLSPFRPCERLTCHGDAKQRAKLDQLPGALPAGSVVARQHVAVDTLKMLRRVGYVS